MKSTAEKVLDAAENLFAEKGYDATSLGDVADRVGIRSPSLYNHYRNKEALYLAVLDRLIIRFGEPLRQLMASEFSREAVFEWQGSLIRLHAGNPNLARLLQHAVLSGGPGITTLMERLFKPLFIESATLDDGSIRSLQQHPEIQPWIIMAFNNIVMSYVTMAPAYQEMLGMDPFCDEAVDRQIAAVRVLTEAFMVYQGKP